MQWVDEQWPRSLQKALDKLWDNFGEAKQGRVSDALDNMEKRFIQEDEVKRMERDMQIMQDKMMRMEEEGREAASLRRNAEEGLQNLVATLKRKGELSGADRKSVV